MDDISKQFGDLIKQERLKQKLSDMDLAMKAGVGRVAISNAEKGMPGISLVDAAKLFYALSIPFERLKFYFK